MRHFISQGYPVYVIFLTPMSDDDLLDLRSHQDVIDHVQTQEITVVLGWEVEETDRVMRPLVFNHVDTDGVEIYGETQADVRKLAFEYVMGWIGQAKSRERRSKIAKK